MPDDDQPVLPYGRGENANSGYSGSETSKARAVEADTSGQTAARQRAVLAYLHFRGHHGATWREAGEVLHVHHGSVSGALSNLHKVGRIVRLAETRNRCKVYVLDEFVDGRDTEPYGKAPNFLIERLDADITTLLRDLSALIAHQEDNPSCLHCRTVSILARHETRGGLSH